MTAAFTGTGTLVRLALRRDRVMLPSWIAIVVLMASSSASATAGLYPTTASRVELATANNGTPSLVALYGRVYDPGSLGAVSLLKMTVFGAVAAAIMSILIMVRHTRGDEETGRLELVGATAIGRRAPLTAALLVTAGADLALGALAALGLAGAGLPVAGSLVAGLAWATAGLAFGALAAVVAQLTESARSAIGLSSAVLGAAYLLRAVGDSSDGARRLSWLSPIGWSQQTRPYAGDRWWAALITLAFTAAVTAAAYALVARRDLGAGLLPDRPGPATASAALRGPVTLAWRLQRTAVLAWTLAFLVVGLLVGGIAGNVGDMVDSDQAREFITKLGGQRALTDAFLATEVAFLALGASVFGIQSALRPRGEETAQRAEMVLATAAGRVRWVAAHLTVALAGTALLMAAAGLGAGLGYAGQAGDAHQVGRVLGAALAQIPAVWVVTGIVTALFGLLPRLTALGWAALAAFLLLGEFGTLFGLPQAVRDVSPFTHVPHLPGGQASAAPLLWLLLVAAALTAAGLYAFRRRDLAP